MSVALIRIESQVIGACLIDTRGVLKAMETVQASDFHHPIASRAFAAVEAITKAGGSVNIGTVHSTMGGDDAADLGFLVEAEIAVTSAAHAKHDATVVRNASTLRQLAQAASAAASAAQMANPVLDAPDAILGDLARRTNVLAGRGTRSRPKPIGDERSFVEAVLEDRAVPEGIRTGFYDLDKLLGGMRDSELIVLAARPSVGKSLLAANIAENVTTALEPTPVLYVSLEMSCDALYRRAVCGRAGLNPATLERMGAMADEKQRLRDADFDLRGAPWEVVSEGGMTLERLRSVANIYRSKHERCLVVVDYLGLLVSPGTSAYERVTATSLALKGLAVELGVPVLALAQLNRGIEQRTNGKPMLSDLRDSGSIEQDADVVLLLHRDMTKESGNRSSHADLTVAKNRPRSTGPCQLWFDERAVAFRNAAGAEELPRGTLL